MSYQVTLDIPNVVYERAEKHAAIQHRQLPEVLTDWLVGSVSDDVALNSVAGVRSLPDDVVLRMSTMQPTEAQETRMSALLERQRESQISASERVELAELASLYDAGLSLKSAALAEAVRRGLRSPLS
jgi:hypothetical protein